MTDEAHASFPAKRRAKNRDPATTPILPKIAIG
jgi:hypothetical protein